MPELEDPFMGLMTSPWVRIRIKVIVKVRVDRVRVDMVDS